MAHQCSRKLDGQTKEDKAIKKQHSPPRQKFAITCEVMVAQIAAAARYPGPASLVGGEGEGLQHNSERRSALSAGRSKIRFYGLVSLILRRGEAQHVPSPDTFCLQRASEDSLHSYQTASFFISQNEMKISRKMIGRLMLKCVRLSRDSFMR